MFSEFGPWVRPLETDVFKKIRRETLPGRQVAPPKASNFRVEYLEYRATDPYEILWAASPVRGLLNFPISTAWRQVAPLYRGKTVSDGSPAHDLTREIRKVFFDGSLTLLCRGGPSTTIQREFPIHNGNSEKSACKVDTIFFLQFFMHFFLFAQKP